MTSSTSDDRQRKTNPEETGQRLSEGLQEIHKAKKELESSIQKLMSSFSERTNLKITDIDTSCFTVKADDKILRVAYEVEIDISLF